MESSHGSKLHHPIRWVAAGVAILVCGGSLLALRMRDSRAQQLPVLGTVGDFLLTERSGKPVTRKTLEGRFWIADFIFTSCAGTCPIMSARMKKLSDELAAMPDVLLVSFSVDAGRDTPPVLRQYADKYHAPADRWLFLTGDPGEIDRLAVNSFKITREMPTPDEILHSEMLFLVDPQGRMRGSYRALSEAESEDLMKIPPQSGVPKDEKTRLLSDLATLRKENMVPSARK